MRSSLICLVTAVLGLATVVVGAPLSSHEVEISKIINSDLATIRRSAPMFYDWDLKQTNATEKLEKAVRATAEALVLARYPNDRDAVDEVYKHIVGATEEDPDGDMWGSPYFSRIRMINFPHGESKDDCEANSNTYLA
ncbi:hypothetical protein BU23DRAFT_575786 [Bimuria novae-zelandiae CBS 107.79]|uniref:Uncharacterized protein n=1 Tax=Bimuria novae-zelandiae CBS 107.79 TaxID=1447943 RepID=A0A6A5UHF9_9PLEO|nr:hypothetical protein BU23DRAFT_575786 [Bimuria novae-zelandiae CBS 107.79]